MKIPRYLPQWFSRKGEDQGLGTEIGIYVWLGILREPRRLHDIGKGMRIAGWEGKRRGIVSSGIKISTVVVQGSETENKSSGSSLDKVGRSYSICLPSESPLQQACLRIEADEVAGRCWSKLEGSR